MCSKNEKYQNSDPAVYHIQQISWLYLLQLDSGINIRFTLIIYVSQMVNFDSLFFRAQKVKHFWGTIITKCLKSCRNRLLSPHILIYKLFLSWQQSDVFSKKRPVLPTSLFSVSHRWARGEASVSVACVFVWTAFFNRALMKCSGDSGSSNWAGCL